MAAAEVAGGGLVGGLGGIVVFSVLPFAVVQLLADSPWGKSLQVRRLSAKSLNRSAWCTTESLFVPYDK